MGVSFNNTTGCLCIQDGNEAAGYVLTSDATGSTYWAAGGGGGGAFTADGSKAAFQGVSVDAGAGSNTGSFAQGSNATASGNPGSFAQGDNALASGVQGSFAQGRAASASGGRGCFAQGYYAKATGARGCFAQGWYLVTASGNYGCFAQGARSIASGNVGSFVQGHRCTASGTRGSFAQGYYAKATGSMGSFAQGNNVTASGNKGSFAQGSRVTASGSNGCFAQGENCTASAPSSWAVGWYAAADKRGQISWTPGRWSSGRTTQQSFLMARELTGSTTPQELFLDGVSEQITIPNNTTWLFNIYVVGRRLTTIENAGYRLEGMINNDGGTTAIIGSVTKTVIHEDQSAWDATATADNTNDALSIIVTGENAKTIYWSARIELLEITI